MSSNIVHAILHQVIPILNSKLILVVELNWIKNYY